MHYTSPFTWSVLFNSLAMMLVLHIHVIHTIRNLLDYVDFGMEILLVVSQRVVKGFLLCQVNILLGFLNFDGFTTKLELSHDFEAALCKWVYSLWCFFYYKNFIDS